MKVRADRSDNLYWKSCVQQRLQLACTTALCQQVSHCAPDAALTEASFRPKRCSLQIKKHLSPVFPFSQGVYYVSMRPVTAISRHLRRLESQFAIFQKDVRGTRLAACARRGSIQSKGSSVSETCSTQQAMDPAFERRIRFSAN